MFTRLFFSAAPALYALIALWVGTRGEDVVGDMRFFGAYAALFAIMLALWHRRPSRWSIAWMLAAALAARAAFLLFPAGDDMNRYVWEGYIQLRGFNPFLTQPNAPELEPLRFSLWEGINHKEITTIYWPFAQLLFRLIAAVSPTITAFKLVFVGFDILVIATLVALLKRLELPLRHVLLYALNPLVLTFIAGEGHLEIVAVFWVVLALFFVTTQRWALAYLSLGLGVMTKFTPVILIPFLLRRNNIRSALWVLPPMLLTLFYTTDPLTLLKTPLMFATSFQHNGLLYSLLIHRLPGPISFGIVALTAGLLMGYIFLFIPNVIRAWAAATYVFLICSPTVHPWYLLAVTPFVVLFRSPPWIILHLTAVGFIFFWRPDTDGWLHGKDLLFLIEYLPFLGGAAWAVLSSRRRWPTSYQPPRTVSVVVPVLNEQDRIARCIETIRSQKLNCEIIVVDGGSTDATVSVARGQPGVTVIESSPGRGVQIREGVRHAGGDMILVLHADSRLTPGSLKRALQALRDNPEAVGGAFGATYGSKARRYRLVEILNNLRASLTGISFGDQAQFFRRSALQGRIPAYVLMEDIELSLLMKESGAVLFLSRGVISSTRRWDNASYGQNVMKVIRLSADFMIRRRLGLLSSDCAEYYRAYYGRSPGG